MKNFSCDQGLYRSGSGKMTGIISVGLSKGGKVKRADNLSG